MYLKNPGPGFRLDRKLPLDCFPLGSQHWHSHPRCWPGGHQLLQATSYLLTNHRGKRLNGSNGFEMLPHIYFPCRNFFFLLVAPSSFKFQPMNVYYARGQDGWVLLRTQSPQGGGRGHLLQEKRGIEAIRESGRRGKRQRENLGRI